MVFRIRRSFICFQENNISVFRLIGSVAIQLTVACKLHPVIYASGIICNFIVQTGIVNHESGKCRTPVCIWVS